MFTVVADGEVEWSAAFGGVVVDEDDASVAEADGIDAGVGIGDIDGAGGRPGSATVGGVCDDDLAGVGGGASIQAKFVVGKLYDRGLDDADGLAPVKLLGRVVGSRLGGGGLGGRGGEGADLEPGLAVVFATFDPDSPGVIALDGGAADDSAVGEEERLGSDGAEDAGGEVLRLRPGSAFVG